MCGLLLGHTFLVVGLPNTNLSTFFKLKNYQSQINHEFLENRYAVFEKKTLNVET